MNYTSAEIHFMSLLLTSILYFFIIIVLDQQGFPIKIGDLLALGLKFDTGVELRSVAFWVLVE